MSFNDVQMKILSSKNFKSSSTVGKHSTSAFTFLINVSTSDANSESIMTTLTTEKINVYGQAKTIRRIYMYSQDSEQNNDYNKVGWMLGEDIDECVICTKQFSLFGYWQHHW